MTDPATATHPDLRTETVMTTQPTTHQQHDEYTELPIPGTKSVGWDIAFGCRINFEAQPGGGNRITVHVSDRAKQDGFASLEVTPDDLRQLARHLMAVAEDGDTDPVATFNAAHDVMTPVRYWPAARVGEGRLSWTRTPAWSMGGHTPVVSVHGYSGGIALTHIEVVTDCPCSSCDPGIMIGDLQVQSRMNVCPTCGSKRCPSAVHHASPCHDAEPPSIAVHTTGGAR